MGRYHHGDLRAATVQASIDLIAECGLAEFSVAAVARRLGVSTAAPYRHFPGRDHLLAEVSATAARELTALLRAATGDDPVERFGAAAATYVGYVARTGCGFHVIYRRDLPFSEERSAATRALMTVYFDLLAATGDRPIADDLRILDTTMALVHGYATLCHDGFFARTPESVKDLETRCAAAVRDAVLAVRP